MSLITHEFDSQGSSLISKPALPTTTKGDIVVHNGTTNVRIGVGSNNQVLTADSAQASGVKWGAVAGTGDVVGPASSTDNAIAVFDGTTGKLLKDSTGTIAQIAANTAKVSNATHTGDVTGSTALTIAAGAVDIAMLATGTDGELITWDASGNPATVAVGTATHVLTSNGPGAAPTFQAAAGGGGTLDTAYDFGGAGSGRTINVTDGTVLLTAPGTSATIHDSLEFNNTTTAAAGTGIGLIYKLHTGLALDDAVHVDVKAEDAWNTGTKNAEYVISVMTAGTLKERFYIGPRSSDDGEVIAHVRSYTTISDAATVFDAYAYSSASATTNAQFRMIRARGTEASPTTVASADVLGAFNFSGYDGTDYKFPVRIKGTVDGTVSTGSVPAAIEFMTGSTGSSIRGTWDSTGDLLMTSTLEIQFNDNANRIWGSSSTAMNIRGNSTLSLGASGADIIVIGANSIGFNGSLAARENYTISNSTETNTMDADNAAFTVTSFAECTTAFLLLADWITTIAQDRIDQGLAI